ncbi:DNA double-strand break repair nuclease NurA [Thermococcus celer]|uniref:5'-3' exonuclease n=1 Tax=Thermococcus celer Vu 13 = JCM 8558 TaxID=1293037 RepID=A0A218P2K0_THECE|nr:DNA double-strand break repair nuclease NurA [Thermococcus celer]ASI99143.1 5'-3' exonuclease [Thermococcus celer] [Thermococcus celer Vu 13 = JCM 8558]
MGYRLLDRESVREIEKKLLKGYNEALEKLQRIEWRELPERRRSRVYAIDGSQGKQRLSGTIFYAVSSYAFGNGPAYRLIYANAMLYNHGISDQIIRLQMETLENKLGFLAGEMGKVDYVMMDGTLTGSLTRPPVYPESVKGITTIRSALGEGSLKELVERFIGELGEHYEELEEKLGKGGKVNGGVILADEVLRDYSEYYTAMEGKEMVTYDGAFREMRKALDGKEDTVKVMEILENLREYAERKRLSLDDARNAVHVVLGYLEYLYSLERLLKGDFDLVYVAKSFYNRKLTGKLDIDIVDVPYLDAYLRRTYGEEVPGYYVITQGGKAISHRMPKVLRERFPTVERFIEKGVPMAYIRTMKGGVIYLLQSNRKIDDDLLAEILWHEGNGYFRPLQRAHEGVKIEKKAFEAELNAMLNIIKAERPELRAFLKYGRSPLE